jgi:hypothetical protein
MVTLGGNWENFEVDVKKEVLVMRTDVRLHLVIITRCKLKYR